MNPSDIKTDGTASHEEVQPNDKSGTEPHKVTLAQGDGEGSTKISLQVWLAILALAFIYNCGLSTFVLVSSVLTYINDDLGPVSTYSWMSSGKTVATATAAILAGTLSDLFGRRWVTIGAGLLGLVGCIVGATAQSVDQVIVAMVLMGIVSGGGLNVFACTSELVTKKQRGPILAALNLSSVMWTSFGSLIANSMVVSRTGWRTIFYVGIALNTIGATLSFFFYKPAKPLAAQGISRRKILANFDWTGLVALTAGPTLLIIAIIWSGGEYEFSSPQVLGTFIPGIVICIGLGFYEAFYAKNPLLHPYLFKQVRTFTFLLFITFTSGMLYYSMVGFFPQYLRLVFVGNDPIQIGIYGLPLGIGSTTGGVLAGMLSHRIGHTRVSLVAGIILQVLFIALLALPSLDQIGMALAFSFLGGFGIGWEQILTIILVQLSTSEEWIGFATGTLAFFRLFGGSVGIAVYTTIFRRDSMRLLPGRVSAAVSEAGLPPASLPNFMRFFFQPSTGSVASVEGVTPEIIEVAGRASSQTYLDSFKLVWYTSIAFGVLTLLAAVFTKDLSDKFDNTIAQKLKNDSSRNGGKDVEMKQDIKTAGH